VSRHLANGLANKSFDNNGRVRIGPLEFRIEMQYLPNELALFDLRWAGKYGCTGAQIP
jgi:hypothetical protein